ncbi:MAG: NYN domain-containing protein [Ignavibacteria bacterium]|jgi:predicted RNA-binding protein with PIN domain
MIKQYLIDGNNVIGKSKTLWHVQKKDKQQSRELLALMVDSYFAGKKIKVILYFDGYQNTAITSKSKINYSNNKPADDLIRRDIENLDNPRICAVISSDHSIQNLAKACSCKVIKSEDFIKKIETEHDNESEQARIKNIDNDEIKKMFGIS